MPQKITSLLLGVSSLSLPLMVISGCGGGSGGLSPSPTPTSLPGVPTATPTAISTSAPFAFDAVFSDRTADVPSTFKSTQGNSTYSNTDAPSANTLRIDVPSESDDNHSISFSYYKIGKINNGDVARFTSELPSDVPEVGVLTYSNLSKQQNFIAKSGTVRITSIGRDPSNINKIIIDFSLQNVQMIPLSGASGNATGAFTINGTGRTTTVPLTDP